jgi:hypothetical protein
MTATVTATSAEIRVQSVLKRTPDQAKSNKTIPGAHQRTVNLTTPEQKVGRSNRPIACSPLWAKWVRGRLATTKQSETGDAARAASLQDNYPNQRTTK